MDRGDYQFYKWSTTDHAVGVGEFKVVIGGMDQMMFLYTDNKLNHSQPSTMPLVSASFRSTIFQPVEVHHHDHEEPTTPGNLR
jgi:hypothetical protein